MMIRASTLLLLASLCLAGPAQAAFDAEVLADASGIGEALAHDTVSTSEGLWGTAEAQAPSAPALAVEGEQGGAPPAPELAAFAPELFLDPHEADTSALIASDLAAAGELATGSVSPSAPDTSPSAPEGDAEVSLVSEPALADPHAAAEIDPSL